MATPLLLSTCLLSLISLFLLYFVYYVPNQNTLLATNVEKYNKIFNNSQSVSRQYEFAIVTDLDIHSRYRHKLSWYSIMARGHITAENINKYHISVDAFDNKSTIEFISSISRGNRSMEFSCLTKWNSKLYAACDYTGIVYELLLDSGQAIPRFVIGNDDNESSTSPMKIEWCTVDEKNRMVIGSIGKEWITPDGSVDPAKSCEWIVKISSTTSAMGSLLNSFYLLFVRLSEYLMFQIEEPRSFYDKQYTNWNHVYTLLRQATNTTYPGYLIHESVLYDRDLKQWIFLPRKASQNIPYNELRDETLASNLIIFVDEPIEKATLENVHVKTVGPLQWDIGFTDIAKIPGTKHHYIATKAVEISEPEPKTKTFLTIFDSDGNILSDPEFIEVEGNMKFEGIEIL